MCAGPGHSEEEGKRSSRDSWKTGCFPVCIDFTRNSWSVMISMIEMGNTFRSVFCDSWFLRTSKLVSEQFCFFFFFFNC